MERLVYIDKIIEVEKFIDRPVIKEIIVEKPIEVIKVVKIEKIIENLLKKWSLNKLTES